MFPIMHLGRPLLLLLARALSQHDGALAAVAQRAGLGFLGDPQLPPVLDHVLVRRPDPRLATMRDRAQTRDWRSAFMAPSRWAGAARRAIGAATELSHHDGLRSAFRWSVSVHSVVGLDFAASLMPGWQETIFPPYFVVGAMYSGFAMVVVPRRWRCAGVSTCRPSSRSRISR